MRMDRGVPGMLQSPSQAWSLGVLQRNLRETFPSLEGLKAGSEPKGGEALTACELLL